MWLGDLGGDSRAKIRQVLVCMKPMNATLEKVPGTKEKQGKWLQHYLSCSQNRNQLNGGKGVFTSTLKTVMKTHIESV